jgi:UDP-N-acetylglucosamine 2-epimerase (non-hydrolysing)
MPIAIVIGTRPEAIKLAPIAERLGRDAFNIQTGQHHTAGMTGHVNPDLVLEAHHDATRGEQLGSMTAALDRVFRERGPDAVIVQGDTTSALAGALAANATDTPLIHVEAGLRSFDRTMPEEHNRVLVDHLADLCCAPTPLARNNLLAEGIPPERIVTTGNTIIEAVNGHLPTADCQADLLAQLGVRTEEFVLATIHRPENTDRPAALETILTELSLLQAPAVLPLHPRTQRQIAESDLAGLAGRLRLTGPLDYTALLTLIQHAAVVISDSGGIQEETTILKRPILVIRRSNERPEVENTFGTRIQPGTDISTITNRWLSDLEAIRTRLLRLASPYGDGTASAQVVHAVLARFAGVREAELRSRESE